MKKFRIYAITPVEFGLFICSSDEKSIEVVMAGLQLSSPTWEFIAYARIPDNHALDRKFPLGPSESTPEWEADVIEPPTSQPMSQPP
jgi:hypothetical protein